MSSSIHRKYNYFQSTEQTAEDRLQKFHFYRLTYKGVGAREEEENPDKKKKKGKKKKKHKNKNSGARILILLPNPLPFIRLLRRLRNVMLNLSIIVVTWGHGVVA